MITDVHSVYLFPIMIDIAPPVILSCPNGPITAEISPDTLKATVPFAVPEAYDNFGRPLQIVTSPWNITSPFDFTTSTSVSYTFFDDARYNATCSFQVNVISMYQNSRERVFAFKKYHQSPQNRLPPILFLTTMLPKR